MSDQQAWAHKAKTSSLAPLQPNELAFLSSARAGIELPYIASLSKRKQTRLEKERLSLLLSKIEAAPW